MSIPNIRNTRLAMKANTRQKFTRKHRAYFTNLKSAQIFFNAVAKQPGIHTVIMGGEGLKGKGTKVVW